MDALRARGLQAARGFFERAPGCDNVVYEPHVVGSISRARKSISHILASGVSAEVGLSGCVAVTKQQVGDQAARCLFCDGAGEQ